MTKDWDYPRPRAGLPIPPPPPPQPEMPIRMGGNWRFTLLCIGLWAVLALGVVAASHWL